MGESLALAGRYGAGDLVSRVPPSWWPDNKLLMAPQRISVFSVQDRHLF